MPNHMKVYYSTPLAEISELRSENVLCASGGNEDFNQKPGSYDFLKPFENNLIK